MEDFIYLLARIFFFLFCTPILREFGPRCLLRFVFLKLACLVLLGPGGHFPVPGAGPVAGRGQEIGGQTGLQQGSNQLPCAHRRRGGGTRAGNENPPPFFVLFSDILFDAGKF